MNCKETVARLQTFVDRELAEHEISEVRMHLEHCPPCHNYFRFEEELKMLVRQRISSERAPAWLRDAIARQFRQEPGLSPEP
jgi:mycothiol system anti-sigma-R factor